MRERRGAVSQRRAASLLAPPSSQASAPRFDSVRTLAYLERMLLADASLGDASLLVGIVIGDLAGEFTTCHGSQQAVGPQGSR